MMRRVDVVYRFFFFIKCNQFTTVIIPKIMSKIANPVFPRLNASNGKLKKTKIANPMSKWINFERWSSSNRFASKFRKLGCKMFFSGFEDLCIFLLNHNHIFWTIFRIGQSIDKCCKIIDYRVVSIVKLDIDRISGVKVNRFKLSKILIDLKLSILSFFCKKFQWIYSKNNKRDACGSHYSCCIKALLWLLMNGKSLSFIILEDE